MKPAGQSVAPKRAAVFAQRGCARLVLTLSIVVLAVPSVAQFSALPPPSATSIGGHHFPLPPPSVSSIKPYGFNPPYVNNGNGRYGRLYGRGRRGSSYGYSLPYYVPFDSYGYGYDYVGGGPDLYSGPPVDPRDPTLHIIVEQPPAAGYRDAPSDPQQSAAPAQPSRQQDAASSRELTPSEPTVLVYRDGHKQEVTNYAIMGQTVYVFDKRTQKIAMSDLDVPATIKTNEAQGIEFTVPASSRTRAKDATVPSQAAPDATTSSPNSLASSLR